MERSSRGSIAISHAPNGQGDGEQRVQTEFWARYVAWSQEGFMTTLCSGMMSDVGAVCGRMGIVVDRWYHHLLVLLLVFLLSLFVRIHSSNRALLALALFRAHTASFVIAHACHAWPRDLREAFSVRASMMQLPQEGCA